MVANKLFKSALFGRRQATFGASVLLSGFSIAILCFCPVVFSRSTPVSLFPSLAQEKYFFSLFGFISASWLLCWVCTLNAWKTFAKVGQWSGLLFLCLDQVSLLGVWKLLLENDRWVHGSWTAPAIVQVYLLGAFFGFFTLPGLTREGNWTLTGLGTLAILLPWLIGQDTIVSGTQHLFGLV